MKQMFLKKVDQIIFAEHEMNHFNHFCIEYRQIAREYGFDVGKLKSSYVKEVLLKNRKRTLNLMKDQRKTKENLCTIQKVEGTTSKQY